MKRFVFDKVYALALVALFLSACGSNGAQKNEPLPPTASISLIELNDLHAHLIPHVEQVKQGDQILLSYRGGLARIKTLIDTLHTDNSIVMGIGDTYHGGAEALFSNGNDIVELVNELGIDIGVIGNWDYAYGPALTVARFGNGNDANVKRPNFEYIAANAVYKVPEQIETMNLGSVQKTLAISAIEKVFHFHVGDNFLAPTKIIEKGGVKIGFIGLTSDIVNKMSPLLAPFIDFTQGQQNYIDLIQTYSGKLKEEGAHVIVVMSELGIHKDVQLANTLNNGTVDLFFSAHTHEATFEPIETHSGAKVVEAGDDTYLGEMQIEVVKGVVAEYKWKLHEITQDIPADTAMVSKVQNIRTKYLAPDVNITTQMVLPNIQAAGLNQFEGALLEQMNISTPPIHLEHPLDEIIGTSSLPLERKNVLENGFNSVFAQLLKNYFHSDIALVAGFRYDSSIIPSQESFTGVNKYAWTSEENVKLEGNISIEDIYRFLPATNYVATGKIGVPQLKHFIENELISVFSKDAFQQAGGWLPGFDGLRMEVDIDQNDGSKLLNLRDLDNKPLNDNAVLSVASGCARPVESTSELAQSTLCGQSLFSEVTQYDQNLSTADFLIQAFKNNLDENLTDEKRVQDISGELLWPKSDYVQPF